MEVFYMARFTLPRDLYHGKGALEALKTFKGKKAIICVGGGSMKRFGFLQKAEDYLKEAGMEVKLFEGIEPDPSVETVMKGAAVMQEFEPDWIVAMGGGSPIDAAKAMWIKYEYPDITFEDMCKVFGIPALRNKAHFCAISSTSGTATEVTAFSIITDYEKGIKYPIADFEITPDVAIVDPDLAETMPQKLVAHTGMDAMTHAIEAYVSTANCDFTDPLALHAIKMIQSDLIPSYNGDMEKRDSMHNAQCLAGMAFSNALLGIVHSMAHKTGAAFADYGAHIIHGAANAMYQPKDIQECFSAYGVTNYVDMIGNNEAPGAWYPMYSYTTSLSANSPAGQVRDRMDAVKHKWLPQVIMAEDFETAWEQYMEAYDSCNPEIYYQMLQLEVEKRVKG